MSSNVIGSTVSIPPSPSPSPTSPVIDVLDYMLATLTFSTRQHLIGTDPGSVPSYSLWLPGEPAKIILIKGSSGFPADINYYDDQFIYQLTTEGPSGWSDPSSYKKFISKSWPNAHGGIAWSPRYHVRGQSTPIITYDSSYVTMQGGKQIALQNLGGPVVTSIQGPYSLVVGSLGLLPVLVQHYMWGARLENLEVNWYALGYGHVRWQSWYMSNPIGLYALTADRLCDQITPGGTPALNFPDPLP
jgi:hypothetical protein